MNVIKSSAEIIDTIDTDRVMQKLERIGRVCYKSEDLIDTGTAEKFLRGIIKSGHETILEHESVSVRFVVDRGVSHEIVRHRIASYSQESTRYCNYGKGKYGSELTFIKPLFFIEGTDQTLENFAYESWRQTCQLIETKYLHLVNELKRPAQEARSILPNSIKTEIVMTTNLREWRHFFKLRAVGTTGKPHPQMLEVTIPLLAEFKKKLPVIFEDINVCQN